MKLVHFFILLVKIFFTNANYPKLDGRIVGGEKVSISEFPYQVSLRNYDNHICGASIIHQNYVLTAAHCVINGNPRSYNVRVGSTSVSSGGVLVKVCDITNHEHYAPSTMVNDIAILKLCTPLSWSSYVKPVALAGSSDNIPVGTLAIVSGWGYTRENGHVSESLQRVSVPLITIARCKSLYPSEVLTANMLCAGYVGTGNKDACQGDSGGPLYANGKQIGVVSWGYGCAQPNYPGVYTNVGKYRNWIRRITNI